MEQPCNLELGRMDFDNYSSVVVQGLLQTHNDPGAGFCLTFQREGTREVRSLPT